MRLEQAYATPSQPWFLPKVSFFHHFLIYYSRNELFKYSIEGICKIMQSTYIHYLETYNS